MTGFWIELYDSPSQHADIGPTLLPARQTSALAGEHWLKIGSMSDKNSSGDEIANVNFLRRYGTYVLQNTKKENLLRLTN